MVRRAPSRILSAYLKILLLIIGGVKNVLSTSLRRPMGCAGHSNGMMSRWTLPHPKLVQKTRTPKYGESLGRCNRPKTTSKGRHWLRCVLSGLNSSFVGAASSAKFKNMLYSSFFWTDCPAIFLIFFIALVDSYY
jgi:hypothetical protein